jgi:hypothetical protein
MAKPGQNKGNRNAAKKPGERTRVNFTDSISGKRLLHLIQYMKAVSGDESEPSDEEIAAFARQMKDEWIDQLQV